jgi:hypothetical protein
MTDPSLIDRPVRFEPAVVSRIVRAAKDLPGVMFFAVAFAIVIWS